MKVTVHHGDARAVLAELPDDSVHAILTDPPYEMTFMGKQWDGSGIAYDVAMWRECLRVLKPGGYLAAFGGTRTYHRMACAIEDAGADIRDSLLWLHGQGFPKSLDVGKAIDKAAGAEPIVLGPDEYRRARANRGTTSAIQPSYDKPRAAQAHANITAPATPAAAQWQGFGTALKPAHEQIVLARRPFPGNVAANVLTNGVGGLNIDGCRTEGPRPDTTRGPSVNASSMAGPLAGQGRIIDNGAGRWPTNVLLSHLPECDAGCAPGCAVAELDAQSGTLTSGMRRPGKRADGAVYGTYAGENPGSEGSSGGASRFYPTFRYQPKAPAKERPKVDGMAHPTVKPLGLVRWLARLLTPPGGVILDPFAGSGTTIEAAILERFPVIGVESGAAYLPMIDHRIGRATRRNASNPEARHA